MKQCALNDIQQKMLKISQDQEILIPSQSPHDCTHLGSSFFRVKSRAILHSSIFKLKYFSRKFESVTNIT